MCVHIDMCKRLIINRTQDIKSCLNRFSLTLRFGGGFFAIRTVISSVTGGMSTEFELQDVSQHSYLT